MCGWLRYGCCLALERFMVLESGVIMTPILCFDFFYHALVSALSTLVKFSLTTIIDDFHQIDPLMILAPVDVASSRVQRGKLKKSHTRSLICLPSAQKG